MLKYPPDYRFGRVWLLIYEFVSFAGVFV